MNNDKELRVYNPMTDEGLLVGMYYDAAKDGTLDAAFHPQLRLLCNFLTFFRFQCTLGIGVDSKGIWFAFSAEPMLDGVQVGVWVREDRRHTHDVYTMAIKAHDELFKVRPLAITMSPDAEKQELFKRFGYKPCGSFPKAFQGRDVAFFALTKDEYEQHKRTNRTR